MFETEDRGATPRRKRLWTMLAGGAVLGAATVIGGASLSPKFLSADENKPADKKAAEKKPDYKPEDVRVGPPPELDALRKAVEEAAKKGENVDDVRKKLDELEKALAGKAWVRPHAPMEPARPAQPPANGFGRGGVPAFPQIQGLPLGGDRDAIRKMQEQMARMMEDMQKNPENGDALQKMIEAQQRQMMQALGQLGGRIAVAPGIGIAGADPLMGRGFGRAGTPPRLGIQMEKVPIVVSDQLELPAGRGVVVAEVVAGTAAEKAGFKVNDIVIEMAGQPVTDDLAEFSKRVAESKAGEKIDFTVLRKGKKETLKVEMPETAPARRERAENERPFGAPAFGGISGVRIAIVNGEYNLQSNQDGVEYTIKGSGEKVSEIVIKDGDKTVKAESIDKVPEPYKDTVEKLIGGVRVGRR